MKWKVDLNVAFLMMALGFLGGSVFTAWCTYKEPTHPITDRWDAFKRSFLSKTAAAPKETSKEATP